MRIDGGQTLKIDPSKHGDLGSWNCNAEPDASGKKKK
jgi:hypothetical protein